MVSTALSSSCLLGCRWQLRSTAYKAKQGVSSHQHTQSQGSLPVCLQQLLVPDLSGQRQTPCIP